MLKTVDPVYLVLLFCCFLPAEARNLVVVLTVAETKAKIPDFKDLVAYNPQFEILARGVENRQDTTYLLKDLPDRDVVIACEFKHSLYTQDLKTLSGDTISFTVPQSAVQYTVNLKEVEVKADNSYLAAQKEVYLTSKRDRRISTNGATLIQSMAIPTIYVSPIDNSVKTDEGEDVSMYIDYQPASSESVSNLNPADVMKVEVYNNPADPRFNGDRHVINFILVKYEYGGYTRLDAEQRFVQDRGSYGVYSKMAYKKMNYEVSVRDNYFNTTRTWTDRYSTYVFPDETVEQSSITDYSKQKLNGISGFFKASYGGKNAMIDNTFGVGSTRVPGDVDRMTEMFSSGNYQSGKSERYSRSTTTGVSWSGSYFFNMPSNWALSLLPSAAYSKFNNYYEYRSSGSDIVNDNVDKSWTTALYARLTKQFGTHSINMTLSGAASGNDMKYGGTSSATIKARDYEGGIRLQGSLRFGKVYSAPSVSLYYKRQTVGGFTVDHWFPKYYIPFSYTINGNLRLNFSSEFYYGSVPISNMAPNMQQQNQIMAIKGNPDLKTSLILSNDLSFYWRLSRSWSIVPAIRYYHASRAINYCYEPIEIDGHNIMMRGIFNNGLANDWRIGLPITFRTNNQSLSMRVSPQFYFVNKNGVMGVRKNYVNFNSQVTYSFSNFYVTGNYQTRSYSFGRAQHSYIRQYYSFGAGWSCGQLKLTANVICPFTSSYRQGHSEIITSDYISNSINYSPNYRCSFMLSANYTISYGKKISRNNESQAPGGAQSGLLK